MKVISAIERRQQASGILRIASDFIEVNQRVKVPGRANPVIHSLTVYLIRRSGMVVLRAAEWHYCSADHFYIVGVSARDDLLIGSNHSPYQGLMLNRRRFGFSREGSDVIDA